MLSIDTNIFLHAQNADSPENSKAVQFLMECSRRSDVVICELVLVELYILLRNPMVVSYPMDAKAAADVCQSYRNHPRWRLVENAPIMERVWGVVSEKGFARRNIMDVRFALTLQHHGVTELATVNIKDFQKLGFSRIWNPL